MLVERLGDERHGADDDPCLDCNMAASIMRLNLTPPISRILALDLGKKRIGLAISDPLGITAQGLPNLSAPTSAPTSTRSENSSGSARWA